MMRWKTSKKKSRKIYRDIEKKVDRDLKKKYPNYKTRAEKSRELRQSKKRAEIMELIFLIQNLQTTGQLNEEIKKMSNHLPSEFDRFL